MKAYNKRKWLNRVDSHYTGSIVCHDGIVSNRGKDPARYTFIEIADCHGKARIHYDDNLDMNAYIEKLKIIRSEVDDFILHLENKNEIYDEKN